jgi:hypothetical protein
MKGESMHFDSRLKAAAGIGSLVALLAALAAGGSATAAPQVHASACQKATNIEAIIDDSGSMDFTDPSKFRTTLLDAFAALQQNQGKTLGGIEFGDTADVLFAPAAIPGVIPAMDASFANVNADNGSTDYNLAFATAQTANPNADGRIFLSDGGHNVGTYNNGHASPPIKTDTVGFGSVDTALLDKIASDTGGLSFNLLDSSQVPAVAAGITADMNCKRPPLTFVDNFSNQGQTFSHSFKPSGKSADILETWSDPNAVLNLTGFSTAGKGKASASSVAHVSVKAVKKSGKGFVTVHLKGLKKGKRVKFKVRATTLPAPTTGTASVIR